jgi:hypothetical protein
MPSSKNRRIWIKSIPIEIMRFLSKFRQKF